MSIVTLKSDLPDGRNNATYLKGLHWNDKLGNTISFFGQDGKMMLRDGTTVTEETPDANVKVTLTTEVDGGLVVDELSGDCYIRIEESVMRDLLGSYNFDIQFTDSGTGIVSVPQEGKLKVKAGVTTP